MTQMSEATRAIFQTQSNPASGPDPGFLWDFWYPALRSNQIRGNKLATAMLLEVPLVLGRTADGKAFAMRDSCPHRGIPLSYGHFDGKVLECSYHGWRFDASSAQCLEIPSLTSQDKLKVDRIFAGHYPCEEREGYVWVYMNAPGTRLPETVPAAPVLPLFSEKYKIAHLVCDLPSHVDQGIIGLMDPAHGPFVHQSWFWRKRASIHEKQKQFEALSTAQENHRRSRHHHHRLRPPQSPHGNRSQRQAMVLQPRHGHPNPPRPLPHRFCRRLEHSLSHRALSPLRRKVPEAGPANHDPASRRPEAPAALDPDRRRRPPGQMVFRAESQPPRVPPHRRPHGPSHDWPSHAPLALLKS
jgi:phenylpropionate dioxygenase-like ring-hydroxylating dioxygenase large terminal subunit